LEKEETALRRAMNGRVGQRMQLLIDGVRKVKERKEKKKNQRIALNTALTLMPARVRKLMRWLLNLGPQAKWPMVRSGL
jgi:hypothetical protein